MWEWNLANVCVCVSAVEMSRGSAGRGGVGYVTLYIVHKTQIGGSLNIMAACQHFVIFSVCLPIELVSPMSEAARLLNQIGNAIRYEGRGVVGRGGAVWLELELRWVDWWSMPNINNNSINVIWVRQPSLSESL